MVVSRKTRQKEILSKEAAKFKTFFSAEGLHERVKKQNIGIATVYRFLNDAVKNKELHVYLCNRRKIYSSGKKSHCHFECEQTGKIIHFDLDNIDFIKDKIPGKITSFQLEVKGILEK